MQKEFSRRSFLQIFTTSAVAVSLLKVGRLFAADMKTLPKGAKALDEKAPMANALGYKHDVASIEPKHKAKFDKMKAASKFPEGPNCANCLQYIKKNDTWGECKIIKGGLVAAGGWCGSYLATTKK